MNGRRIIWMPCLVLYLIIFTVNHLVRAQQSLTAQITNGKDQYGPCENVVFSSRVTPIPSTANLSNVEYTWKLVYEGTVIQVGSLSSITFPYQQFQVPGQFTIQLNVAALVNGFYRTNNTMHIFTKLPSVPIINVFPRDRLTIYRRELALFEMTITWKQDCPYSSLNINWQQMDGPLHGTSSTMMFEPYSFPVEETIHTFQINASTPFVTVTKFVTIQVLLGPIEAIIAEKDTIVSENSTLVLNGAVSYDPDDPLGEAPARYQWTCNFCSNDIILTENKLVIPNNTLTAGTYTFGLTFIKGFRTSSTNSKITITNGNPLNVTLIGYVPRYVYSYQKLHLEGFVVPDEQSNTNFSALSYKWTMNSGQLITRAIMLSNSDSRRFLALQNLENRRTYTFRLTARTKEIPPRYGYVETKITVINRDKIYSGYCLVNATEGVAYDTMFAVTCYGFELAITPGIIRYSLIVWDIDRELYVYTSAEQIDPVMYIRLGSGRFKLTVQVTDGLGYTLDSNAMRVTVANKEFPDIPNLLQFVHNVLFLCSQTPDDSFFFSELTSVGQIINDNITDLVNETIPNEMQIIDDLRNTVLDYAYSRLMGELHKRPITTNKLMQITATINSMVSYSTKLKSSTQDKIVALVFKVANKLVTQMLPPVPSLSRGMTTALTFALNVVLSYRVPFLEEQIFVAFDNIVRARAGPLVPGEDPVVFLSSSGVLQQNVIDITYLDNYQIQVVSLSGAMSTITILPLPSKDQGNFSAPPPIIKITTNIFSEIPYTLLDQSIIVSDGVLNINLETTSETAIHNNRSIKMDLALKPFIVPNITTMNEHKAYMLRCASWSMQLLEWVIDNCTTENPSHIVDRTSVSCNCTQLSGIYSVKLNLETVPSPVPPNPSTPRGGLSHAAIITICLASIFVPLLLLIPVSVAIYYIRKKVLAKKLADDKLDIGLLPLDT